MAGARHGGAEAFFVRLVAALARAGLESRVVVRGYPERRAALARSGIAPVELGFGGPFDLATRIGLAREIRRFRPHVVLTWMNRATTLLPPQALCGVRFVHAARLGGYYDLKYYRRADHLVANTRDIARHLVAAGWPERRVHYLPNFVDAGQVEPVDRVAQGVAPGATLALALGRLHPNKGFDVLLKALAGAPAVHLWLAGEGEERASLEAQAARLGLGQRVRFLGWREDAGALIAAADMVVCPSRIEPLGNVVIEAWARARPVIATACAGPAALIAHESSGLLVPIDDASALAAALTRLAGDPALKRRLAAAGRLAYESEFTEAAVVAQYLAFFARIAS